MPRHSRTSAGLLAAVSLHVVQAAAQPTQAPPPEPAASPAPAPPEALETPYAETPPGPIPPPPPASPPPPAAPAAKSPRIDLTPSEVPDTRPRLPIRAQRRLVLTGEMGWNGLAGFGPVLTYHAHPHVALDLGLGFSLTGWKAGLRGRYNLLSSPLTPFLGVGFTATSGLGEFTTDPASDPQGDPNREPATINVKASYFTQFVVGLDYTHRRGFTLLACLGYAHLLNDNNVRLIDGELTDDEEKGFDIAFKGGPVITLGLGYAFE